MNCFAYGFRHYADFTGRDSRSRYWVFITSTQLVLVLLAMPAFVAFAGDLRELLQDFLLGQCVGMGPEELLNMEVMRPLVEDYFGEYFSAFGAEHSVATYFLLADVAWALLITIPTIAATVRRLRDAGQSLWWVLPPCLSFVPYIGVFATMLSIVTLALCCFGSALPPLPAPAAAED